MSLSRCSLFWVPAYLAWTLLSHTVCHAQEVIQLTSEEFFLMATANEFRAIVDVRTIDEWNDGHIENATLLESLQLAEDEDAKFQELAGCQDCPIVVYCRSGARAGAAIDKLVAAGFQGPLYNGLGVSQWEEAGYDLVATDSTDPECQTEEPGELYCADRNSTTMVPTTSEMTMTDEEGGDEIIAEFATDAPTMSTPPEEMETIMANKSENDMEKMEGGLEDDINNINDVISVAADASFKMWWSIVAATVWAGLVVINMV